MSDEGQLNSELNRAYRAQILLDDELLTQAFADIEATYLSEWENSPARDTEGREKIWMAIKMLRKVRGDLSTHVETGKMARSQLDNIKDKIKTFF